MKFFIALLILIPLSGFSKDLTPLFDQIYQSEKEVLKTEDIAALQESEIVLVNGIMSEFFLRDFYVDVSWITSEYFQIEKSDFEKKGLSVTRIAPSSFSMTHAHEDIARIFTDLRAKQKKAILFTHSLGGLLLLDHILANPKDLSLITGIIFMQSPFHGSPVATLLRKAPLDTMEYLKPINREKIMVAHEQEIKKILATVPVITIGGVTNGYKTLFQPAVNFIKHGCVTRAFGRCTTPRIYHGPYDDSDGMVPLKSSYLFDADHITLETVDHGETVMNLPYQSILKSRLGEVLMKMLELKRKENEVIH
jgi:hypothetical protein